MPIGSHLQLIFSGEPFHFSGTIPARLEVEGTVYPVNLRASDRPAPKNKKRPVSPAGINHRVNQQGHMAQPTDSENQQGPLDGLKVLLVEDSRSFQLYCAMLLEDAGAVVSVASNGKEGLEQVEKGYFELVLMDIDMPVMDGLEATRAIRELEGHRAGIKIMAVTSKSTAEELASFQQAGMDDALAKPFEAEELIHKAAALTGRPMTQSESDQPMIDLTDLWEKSRGSSQFVCTMLQNFFGGLSFVPPTARTGR